MKREFIHLTVETVKAIHAEVLAANGGSDGIGAPALLESAVSAPQATMMGKPIFSDTIEIAAAYLFYLCKNHPFMDGNKRTALAACWTFLNDNGFPQSGEKDVDAWESLVIDLASSRIGRDETTERLRRLLPSGIQS